MKIIFFTLSMLVIIIGFGQEKNKRILIKEAYLVIGFNAASNPFFTVDDFRILNPNSELNDPNFYDFDKATVNSFFGFYGSNFNPNFSVFVGLHLYDKNNNRKNGEPVLRLGINHVLGSYSVNYSHIETEPFNTIYSAVNGHTFL